MFAKRSIILMQYVSHPWLNGDVIEKRSYQDAIVNTALSGNTLVVLPTGLGKTSIAALVTAEVLRRGPDGKILFMAPTRPLVNQHKKNFERFFKLGVEFATITGEDNPGEREALYKANVIFSTPQTIRNDLKAGKIDLSQFSLCIFDEAHRAVGNYAYSYIAKVYSYHKGIILALTASPGSQRQKIEEIKRRLYIDKIEIRDREDEDVAPYVQEMKQQWIEVELSKPMYTIRDYLEKSKEPRISKLMSWKIIRHPQTSKSHILKLQEDLAKKKTGMSWAAMGMLAEVLKIDHSLMLLETQCLHSLMKYFDLLVEQREKKSVARLLNDENFKNAMRLTTELLAEGKEHPKMEKLKEIIGGELQKNKFSSIIVFSQYRDTISKINDEMKSVQNAAPIEFIGQAKKKGKGLSQKEQMQILNEFKMGFHNVLIASQVGEEGLDITETDTVIFYEPVPSAVRRVQRMGRTARTKAGQIFMLMTRDTRDEAYHWSGFQKERKMKDILHKMQKGQKSVEDFRA